MTPNGYGLRFHHFGLAVRDAGRAKTMLRGLGYSIGEQIHDPLQKVMLTWCEHEDMPAVELVSPADEPGPLDNILSSQPEMLYHLCYESADIAAATAAISGDGIRVITVAAPKPAVLFGGRQVGFYQVRGFGLIEIVEAA
ncbi:MAG: hypothetical protein HKO62_00165 [Gammaproteobacteria bacterium]|nr:VOC family protein [Gammaproteobacteria bacterium]NNL99128.1 hypothetical protein [Gammaproteobacteria bacterium]